MNIDFANLQFQYKKYKSDIDKQIQSVLNSSIYIMGEKVNELEIELKNFTGTKYAISCSSGTDALLLSLMAIEIKPGDEVITTPFTWISTAETIAFLKAKPVFVDIDKDTFNMDYNQIEAKINKKTKAIMPVNLFGQPADINEIQNIAKKYSLKVIIDGAQSFGSKYFDKTDSDYGDISITSFFPSKPLGCYGDGGAVFTNDDYYAEKIKMLRVHGQLKKNYHKYIGIGGRLDAIQAAILLAKLPYFNKEIENRQNIAKYYSNSLKDILLTPILKPNRTSAWAQYTIKSNKRDFLLQKLKEKNIPTAVFYPQPLHLQECFKYLGYKKSDFPTTEEISDMVISLPMNPFLNYNEIDHIISVIKKNYK